jgi:diguanylate cyclase (GGDEF)-like protein/PAS domain S-box-containing protein
MAMEPSVGDAGLGPASSFAGMSGLIEPGSLLEATPECLVLTAADGRIVFANRRVQDLTGFDRSQLVDRHVDFLLAGGLSNITATTFEAPCHRAAGEDFPVEVHLGHIDGPERLLVVTLRDMTELKEGREARFEAEAKYRALVDEIPAVVYLDPVDENADSIYVSPQVTALIGVSPHEWLTDNYCWRHHVHPDDIERVWDEYVDAYEHHTTLNHEYRMVHEDGTVKWVLEQATTIRDEKGVPWLIQGVIFDITERKRAEDQVAFLAYHDSLTGLPNRVLFEEMLGGSIARARRHDLGVGVIYLDLDNFKLVNDSLGHQAGDMLLSQLGERLRECTRETDLVARQGGDEFLLLLSDLERGSGTLPGTDAAMLVAESVATRVHEALREPFDLDGIEFFASASLGISLFPTDANDATGLLRNADAAMYQSKRNAPGGYVLFSSDDDDPMERLSLSTRLRRAVEDKNWVLHYQPILDLGDGTVKGVEALVRWQDPNGGIVPPGEFIPLAEEMGLIEAIGDWVLEELTSQHRLWRTQHDLDLEISFNLSPRQLWSPNLAEHVLERLRAGEVDPTRIVVEITESTAMADPDRTQRILAELHAWGLTLAIDDFGTGYSSLARLKHMPVQILKIDRSFVRDVDRDRDLAGMVRAMIQLAQSLGMTPLAEGIETRGEYEFLRANGCRLAQGFLFSRPVPAAEIPALARGQLAPHFD